MSAPAERGRGGRLVVVGTSHHRAPVAVRERLAATAPPDHAGEGKGAERAAESLADAVRAHVGPAVVLSTCNRLEVYCWTTAPRARERIARVLAAWGGLPVRRLSPYLYARTGVDAATHLVRVAAGLDSLAVGESQVLGQVRAAWMAARRERALGHELELLFRRSLEAGRRIRRLGAFDRHPSVAGLAVAAAADALGGLGARHVAVLGAGVTGQEALRGLLAGGVRRATLLNRSRRRLAAVRGDFPGERVHFGNLDALHGALVEADALICATSAPEPVVAREAVQAARGERGARDLVIVDVAVPRDVDPSVRALPGVRLVDLDDLATHCALDAPARREALERADALARAAGAAFAEELRRRTAAREIAALRTHAEAVRRAALAGARGRLSQLSERELATVEQLTHAIVQKLLHPPTVALRRAAGADASARRARRAILAALTDPAAFRRHPSERNRTDAVSA